VTREKWLITALWFVVVTVAGVALAVVLGHGRGVAAAVVGVLVLVGLGGLVFFATYRRQKKASERRDARSGRNRR
jgi:O-antigen/teichoic acid export membrane protein